MGLVLSPCREFVYHNVGKGTWHRHLRISNRHYSYHMEYMELNEAPSGTLSRASIRSNKTHISVLNTSIWSDILSTVDEVYYTFDTITLREPSIKWFMSRLKWSESTSKLRESIVNGSVVAVSDGYYFPRYEAGACTWIIVTPDFH